MQHTDLKQGGDELSKEIFWDELKIRVFRMGQ